MLKLTFVIIISICALNQVCGDESNPKVCFDKGCVRGKVFKGNLKEFEGFLGIPFAKPPVNELRLKDPQPIDNFSETYDATSEKMYCMQKNYLLPNPTVSGVEDCLYLYVYRPKNGRTRKLPVLVYIHGGGFFAGTAGPSITGSEYFMDTEDVIFVSMNYRLGPLGFLSTGDSNMSGNFGLKDQALAIKWVKDNIEAFGGNSSNIALIGQSAGASSAHLHMMSSPKWSRNLFQSVVMFSGLGVGPYAYVIKNPLTQAKNFAKAIEIENYSEMKTSELAERLRRSDPVKLIEACDKLKIWSVDPLTISRPVVEDCKQVDGFLCEDPVDLWRSGNHAKVPIISGFMDGDGGVRALSILEDKSQLSDLNNRFDELMPKLMEIEDPSLEVTETHMEMIKERYFAGRSEITNDTSDGLIRLYSERSFIAPLINTVQQLVQQDPKAQAYIYKFSHNGPISYSPFYTGNAKNYGSVHCDELIYILHSPMLFPVSFEEKSVEAMFRTKFVRFFTDFVINGKPPKINGKTVQKCGYPQKSVKSSFKCNYIEFGDLLSIKFNEIDMSIAEFWNEIDKTMVNKVKPHQIEVTNILKNSPFHQHQTFMGA